MPKAGQRTKEPTTTYGFLANVDMRTIKMEGFATLDDAEAEAERCMKVGIWDRASHTGGRGRLIPPHAILFIETFEKTL